MPDGHYALNLDSTTFPHEDPSAREHLKHARRQTPGVEPAQALRHALPIVDQIVYSA
jgi:hypothetical protein